MTGHKKGIGWEIFLLLTLVILPGCTLDRIAAQQAKATGLWDELVGGESFGQSFVSGQDYLYRIDLSTATFARDNSAPVIFYLKNSPEGLSVILSVTLSGAEIQNERPTSILFAPIPDSAGQSYYFYIESPKAFPGNAITVYANEPDQYPDGSAYRNGQVASGDLAFTAYSRQTYTFAGILQSLFSRAAQDAPFFLCYGLLIVALSVGLFLSFRRRA